MQTAHQIALKLNVPIKLSSSLAQSAAAVDRSGDRFDFLSDEELKYFTKGVKLIDEYGPGMSPVRWDSYLSGIARSENFAIAVAHRETIRDMVVEFGRRRVPYCGVSLFDHDDNYEKGNHLDIGNLVFRKIIDRNGEHIFSL